MWVTNNWQDIDSCVDLRRSEALSTRCGGQGVVVFYGMAKPVRAPQYRPSASAIENSRLHNGEPAGVKSRVRMSFSRRCCNRRWARRGTSVRKRKMKRARRGRARFALSVAVLQRKREYGAVAVCAAGFGRAVQGALDVEQASLRVRPSLPLPKEWSLSRRRTA